MYLQDLWSSLLLPQKLSAPESRKIHSNLLLPSPCLILWQLPGLVCSEWMSAIWSWEQKKCKMIWISSQSPLLKFQSCIILQLSLNSDNITIFTSMYLSKTEVLHIHTHTQTYIFNFLYLVLGSKSISLYYFSIVYNRLLQDYKLGNLKWYIFIITVPVGQEFGMS